MGIPEEDARAYNEQISHGESLVILEGTKAEIELAGYVLRNQGIHESKVYEASGNMILSLVLVPSLLIAIRTNM